MTEIQGFAVPMMVPLIGTVRGEHTYVMSNEGDRWGCGGRAAGGRLICRGRCDVQLARCLAGPHHDAGIRYGVTGICHQIANRVLWPADVLVDRAKGYSFCLLLYAQYGRGSWPELDFCCHLLGAEDLLAARKGEPMAEPPKKTGLSEPEAAYVTESSEEESFVDESVSILRELVDRNLGGGLDPGKRARLEQIIARMAREQYDLIGAIEHGHMSAEDYFDHFARLVRRTFDEMDRILGRTDFERVFGAPPEAAQTLIDPEAFARAHGLEIPPRVPE